jgi:hypothetical protein
MNPINVRRRTAEEILDQLGPKLGALSPQEERLYDRAIRELAERVADEDDDEKE